MYKVIAEKGFDAGFKTFEEIRGDSESKLNAFSMHNVDIMLLKEGKIKEALQVCQKNFEVFEIENIVIKEFGLLILVSY